MRVPRREIVMPDDIVHIIWRCHNGSHLLFRREIKEKIIDLYFKYCDQYNIKIIDFQNLDNHVHWVLKAPDAESLGAFTKTVHSQIASYVNTLLKRNSQVIRDRYKSPPVRDERYCERLIGYVLLNRLKADKTTRPEHDPCCSAYHRIHNTKYGKQLANYSDLGLCKPGEDLKYLNRLLKHCISKLFDDLGYYDRSNFTNQFAVGSQSTILKIIREISDRKKTL